MKNKMLKELIETAGDWSESPEIYAPHGRAYLVLHDWAIRNYFRDAVRDNLGRGLFGKEAIKAVSQTVLAMAESAGCREEWYYKGGL